MLASAPPADTIVEGLARRQRRLCVLEAMRDATHRALLGPVGRHAREALIEWGLPEPSLHDLDLGYVPDPASLTRELERRGASASEAEDAGLIQPAWSGRVVGPWRNQHGRILTFFAWRPERAARLDRYAFAGSGRPPTLFTASALGRHLVVVEGLLDVLLASCYGMDGVAGVGGPLSQLSSSQLGRLALKGVHELTLLPAHDEAGRTGVLAVLEHADSPDCPALEVFVVDPAMLAGARDLGEFVRRAGSRALTELNSWRMEGEVYRTVLVPWQ